ncbi:hypothetical protein ACWGS9_31960 [Bradyrhizobium sp. Arg314]
MAGIDPATSPTGSDIQPNDPRLRSRISEKHALLSISATNRFDGFSHLPYVHIWETWTNIMMSAGSKEATHSADCNLPRERSRAVASATRNGCEITKKDLVPIA